MGFKITAAALLNSLAGILSVSKGGTGQASLTDHGVLVGGGTGAVDALAVGATGQVLRGATGADPAFAALNLTTDVGASILPPANGGVANITTAGRGGFFPGLPGLAGFSPGAGTIVSSNNQVRARQFVLTARVVVANITLEVSTTGGGGSTVTVGIYDAAGTTKLIDSGTFDGNSGTVQTKAITPVTLEPGVYWFAFSASVNTIQCRRIDNNSSFDAIMNNSAGRTGTSANSVSGGVMPSSLGVITTASVASPLTWFER